METMQMQMPCKFHVSHVNYANTKQEKKKPKEDLGGLKYA